MDKFEKKFVAIIIATAIFLGGFYLGIHQTKKYAQIVNVTDSGIVEIRYAIDGSNEIYEFETK